MKSLRRISQQFRKEFIMEKSQARIEANRQNALLSTSPKTEEGKKRSSMNALRDGFYSPIDVLPHEDTLACVTAWKPTPACARSSAKLGSPKALTKSSSSIP